MTSSDCICAALRQASRYVSRHYDAALSPVGLGINQYSVLARLARHGPQVMQELARRLVMDRSTLGHLLRPLEVRGFVTLRAGAADGRCRVVSLTPEGEAALLVARPLWAEAQAEFERQFGTDDTAALRAALAAVVVLPPTADPA